MSEHTMKRAWLEDTRVMGHFEIDGRPVIQPVAWLGMPVVSQDGNRFMGFKDLLDTLDRLTKLVTRK